MTTLRAPAALWLLSALLAGGAAGGDPPERLHEPAHEFAREAARALAEQERAWLRRAEELDALWGLKEDPRVPGRPLAAEAAALLARARAVLAAYGEVDRELGRFRAALGLAAPHYRAVADLYAADADQARHKPAREDFQALAAAYARQAAAAEARAGRVGLQPGSASQAAELAEGNRFLERLAEAAAAVPLGREDERLLTARLRRHAERCEALATELATAAKAVLAGSDAAALRPPAEPRRAEVTASPASPPPAAASPSSPRPANAAARDRFPVRYARPPGDWAALVAGPSELSVGDELACERPGLGQVGRLRVEAYRPDAGVFVVRALGGTRLQDGDTARR